MAQRTYICPVIGSGTEADPYRVQIADEGVNHGAIIPSGPDGSPRDPECVVTVEEIDGARLTTLGQAELVASVDDGREMIEARRGDVRL